MILGYMGLRGSCFTTLGVRGFWLIWPGGSYFAGWEHSIAGAQLAGRGGGLLACPFLRARERFPDFWERNALVVLFLWVKILIWCFGLWRGLWRELRASPSEAYPVGKLQ